MPWFKVDDAVVDSLETLRGWKIDPGVFGLDMRAQAWSAKHLTDGFFPTEILDSWFPREDDQEKRETLVFALVTIGRWTPADGGYDLVDYLEANSSRAEIEAMREKKAAAGRKGGSKSKRQAAG